MLIAPEKLKKLLIEPGHIAAEVFAELEAEAQRKRKNVMDLIVDKDLITDEQMGQLLAQELGVPFVNLRNEKIRIEDLHLLPAAVARAKKMIVFAVEPDKVKLGMVDPGDIRSLQAVRKFIAKEIVVYLITARDYRQAMIRYQKSLKEEVQDIFQKFHESQGHSDGRDILIVSLLDTLFANAYRKRVSDIHIEPLPTEVVVRFRIDGVMHTVLNIEKVFFPALVQRIKILARMKIDEHLGTQDGKLQFMSDEEKVDVRVSIVPVSDGENIVMRILSSQNRQMSLSSLGFSSTNLATLDQALKNPHGMILVAGPTGSGKTTTLYEIIKKLNTDLVHIASIEDPVEYNMEGISQIQVNTSISLDFARGLRAILRQDPDVIMVGEIRDAETAKIAVGAAMTGHLVLSTEHSNNSTTALLRLLELGVEPFMTASTVKVIIAQRLVRMICSKCRYSYNMSAEEIATISARSGLRSAVEAIFKKDLESITLYKGSGCKVCADTGYEGRIGIFEILEITAPIKEAVVTEASDNHLMQIARQNGMETMLEGGIKKIVTGVTTLSEVLRVTVE